MFMIIQKSTTLLIVQKRNIHTHKNLFYKIKKRLNVQHKLQYTCGEKFSAFSDGCKGVKRHCTFLMWKIFLKQTRRFLPITPNNTKGMQTKTEVSPLLFAN